MTPEVYGAPKHTTNNWIPQLEEWTKLFSFFKYNNFFSFLVATDNFLGNILFQSRFKKICGSNRSWHHYAFLARFDQLIGSTWSKPETTHRALVSHRVVSATPQGATALLDFSAMGGSSRLT